MLTPLRRLSINLRNNGGVCQPPSFFRLAVAAREFPRAATLGFSIGGAGVAVSRFFLRPLFCHLRTHLTTRRLRRNCARFRCLAPLRFDSPRLQRSGTGQGSYHPAPLQLRRKITPQLSHRLRNRPRKARPRDDIDKPLTRPVNRSAIRSERRTRRQLRGAPRGVLSPRLLRHTRLSERVPLRPICPQFQ